MTNHARFEIRRKALPFRQRWYLVLVGANGQVMATTEPYVSEANARRAADDIRAAVRTATGPLPDYWPNDLPPEAE